jgi:hypothetical protein
LEQETGAHHDCKASTDTLTVPRSKVGDSLPARHRVVLGGSGHVNPSLRFEFERLGTPDFLTAVRRHMVEHDFGPCALLSKQRDPLMQEKHTFGDENILVPIDWIRKRHQVISERVPAYWLEQAVE